MSEPAIIGRLTASSGADPCRITAPWLPLPPSDGVDGVDPLLANVTGDWSLEFFVGGVAIELPCITTGAGR